MTAKDILLNLLKLTFEIYYYINLYFIITLQYNLSILFNKDLLNVDCEIIFGGDIYELKKINENIRDTIDYKYYDFYNNDDKKPKIKNAFMINKEIYNKNIFIEREYLIENSKYEDGNIYYYKRNNINILSINVDELDEEYEYSDCLDPNNYAY